MSIALERSPAGLRARIAERLRERRGEIEEAIALRVSSLAARQADRDDVGGIREAIEAAVEHAIKAVEVGEERISSAPPILLLQARKAARADVGLDSLMRSYFAGHALIADFLIVEAAKERRLPPRELQRLLGDQAAVLDSVSAEVCAEHVSETERVHCSAATRQRQRIERLLAAELPDTSQIPYELEAHHVAAIAQGPGCHHALKQIARQLDRRLLVQEQDEEILWAWLGGVRPLDPGQLAGSASACLAPEACMAIGESAEGLAGWRISHRQAKAALPVAQRRPEAVVRYSDVALLASIIRDELLVSSLRERYLRPLEDAREGEVLRETLRAYFDAGRNSSSTAASLGISRTTVTKRLRAVEEILDSPLEVCASEFQSALSLEEVSVNSLHSA